MKEKNSTIIELFGWDIGWLNEPLCVADVLTEV